MYWFLLAKETNPLFLRRVLNDRAAVVSTVTVSPGEQVLITVRDPQGRPSAGGSTHACVRRSLTPVEGPFAAGERVLLIDPKERRYLLSLVAGATFHTHAGVLAHDDIIGATEGSAVAGSTGRSFLALRPTPY